MSQYLRILPVWNADTRIGCICTKIVVNVWNMYGDCKRPSFVTYSFVFHFHFSLISGHLNNAARFLQDVRWNMSYSIIIIEQRCVLAACILKQNTPLLIGEELKRISDLYVCRMEENR